MPLHRVIYVSDAVGGAGANLLSLVEILGASDRNNRRDHLSGCLVSHAGRFLQVIEGARGDIDLLMGRLRADARHTNIRILINEPVATRRFDAWAMAQGEATAEVVDILNDTASTAVSAARLERLIESLLQRLPQPA